MHVKTEMLIGRDSLPPFEFIVVLVDAVAVVFVVTETLVDTLIFVLAAFVGYGLPLKPKFDAPLPEN